MGKLTRNEIIEIVNTIRNFEGTEEELEEILWRLRCGVLDPGAAYLRRWEDKTAEEIADMLLSYQPIILGDSSMQE